MESDPYGVGTQANQVRWWMEFLTPTNGSVVARYKHPLWGQYAAITRNHFGKGEVTYIGFMPPDELAEKLMAEAVSRAGLSTPAHQAHFPAIIRSGTLHNGIPFITSSTIPLSRSRSHTVLRPVVIC